LGGFNCSRSIERERLALASAGAELRFANGWSRAAKFDGEFWLARHFSRKAEHFRASFSRRAIVA
jgi:hypothetical protein